MPAKRPRFARIDAMPKWTRRGHALGPRWRRLIPSIVGIALLIGTALVAVWLDPLQPRLSGAGRASDGDSFVLQGERIRLIGIDAPELDQVCQDASGVDWPCGRAARDELAQRLAAGVVQCQSMGEDRYGRTLARCAVQDSDVGQHMVSRGMAIATEGYVIAEAQAKSDRRGLWQGRFVDPKTWRDEGPTSDPGPGPFEALWNWFGELTGARTLR